MTYQTLLAHMSSEESSEAVLRVGVLLAERYSAHLLGLHIKLPLDVYISEIPMPIDVTRDYAERQREKEMRLQTLFEETIRAQNFVSEWRSVEVMNSPLEQLVEQGNTADLLIVSQTEGSKADYRFKRLPEHVIMASGRPVLVIPDAGAGDTLGERIMVAWDGRRESTRALFGAVPLLRRADSVRLHRINPPHSDRHHVIGVTAELANTLARHGVALDVLHSDARSGEVADELMGYAGDMDADLMVMGCYGHSPVREFILGGTTRTILGDTRIPLLMSN